MKTKLSILSLALFIYAGALNAKVWTVSNNAITAGHFTSIQTAADSANVGDTIYVMGSPTDYGNVTLHCQVTMIGAGYNVTGTQYNYISEVDNIYIDSTSFGPICSGTKVMGFYISSNFDYNSSSNINDVDIERCYVSSTIYVYGSNWTIRNNDLDGINVQYEGNVFIQNNFINDIQYSNQTTVIIDHNDFVTNSGNIFYSISNAIISNNIFWYCTPQSYVSGCVFSNNITESSSPISLPPSGNTGANNLFCGTTPFSGSVPGSNIGQNSIWNYTWNISTSAKSTTPSGVTIHNSGSDGTDPGVTGGAYPLPNLTGATRIPQMTLMNVSGVVPQGGNMNVNFKARVQN